jgi:hypothetical protein
LQLGLFNFNKKGLLPFFPVFNIGIGVPIWNIGIGMMGSGSPDTSESD